LARSMLGDIIEMASRSERYSRKGTGGYLEKVGVSIC
jgi:hypothetical protein